MTTYKYETHLHTCHGSACGKSTAEEYVKAYSDLGYAGFFVTDHFFGGNTSVPESGTWKDRIDAYCIGYEKALEACKNYPDFKVFFGFEQTFDGDDYLIYGLEKDWLIDHPEIENMRHKELFDAVNSVNGLMIQAHPFRFRQYMRDMHQHPLEVHGIEVYNGGNKTIENTMAELYAEAFNFPVTSGSDIHETAFLTNSTRNPTGGMEFDTPLTSVYDYAERIKSRQGRIIK